MFIDDISAYRKYIIVFLFVENLPSFKNMRLMKQINAWYHILYLV